MGKLEKNKIAIGVQELAKMLGIGINQAYALARSQCFPSFRIGKRLLVPVRDLETWLSEQARSEKHE